MNQIPAMRYNGKLDDDIKHIVANLTVVTKKYKNDNDIQKRYQSTITRITQAKSHQQIEDALLALSEEDSAALLQPAFRIAPVYNHPITTKGSGYSFLASTIGYKRHLDKQNTDKILTPAAAPPVDGQKLDRLQKELKHLTDSFDARLSNFATKTEVDFLQSKVGELRYRLENPSAQQTSYVSATTPNNVDKNSTTSQLNKTTKK